MRTTMAVVPERKKNADSDWRRAESFSDQLSREKNGRPPGGGKDSARQLHVSLVRVFRNIPSLRKVNMSWLTRRVSKSPTAASTTKPSAGPLVMHISSRLTFTRLTRCRLRKAGSKYSNAVFWAYT